ncbi:MAG TPA: hypothetical protein VJ250_03680, partial [Nitrososphaeraceae archaeon]|nr:hypothetical protein [Nitrososphaeraceae archaeon]
MKNETKKSVQSLILAIVAVAVSAAFIVSLSIVPSAAQQVKAAEEVNEKKNNDYYQAVSVQHSNSGSHVSSFAEGNDNLNQTKVTELRISLHDLWVEHIVWTRQYIVGAAADQADASAAAERLMKNQEDIGNAIKPFYGEQAGNQLTLQLKDHILIAVDLLEAAKAGNDIALEEIEEKWYT